MRWRVFSGSSITTLTNYTATYTSPTLTASTSTATSLGLAIAPLIDHKGLLGETRLLVLQKDSYHLTHHVFD
jgi:hypothetical protein